MKKLMILLGLPWILLASNPAPNGPGIDFPWATAEKQGFGTAYESYDNQLQYSSASSTAPISKVWFTIARGIVTETFYPTLDKAQSRDTQLLITDGKSFIHQEQYDTTHEVERKFNAPYYLIKNRDRWNRYTIEKEVWVDPDSQTLIQRVRIERFVNGLKFFVLHKPAAGNTIFGDNAYSNPLTAGERNINGEAWQTLYSNIPFTKSSVGFVGVNDGFKDLTDFRMDYFFDEATNGNVALTGQLNIPESIGISEFNIYLRYSPERDSSTPLIDVETSLKTYVRQWDSYLQQLKLPISTKTSEKRRELLVQSLLVLKSAEDKTYSGSLIASPSNPWGEKQFENKHTDPAQNAGYHVVWPRDLYHISSSLLAVKDIPTATAVINRLKVAQYNESSGLWQYGPRTLPKNGSFPQNFWVSGQALYGGYQADETAMPILLAYRLWKISAVSLGEVWPMVKRAGIFLADMGPWTQTERWEENYGISPNSAAYVISSLLVASEMAFSAGDNTLGSRFQFLADQWATKPNDNIDTWTFTTQGRIQGQLGNGKYYLRLSGARCHADGSPIFDAQWDPNNDGLMLISNIIGPERFKFETEIVDAGFLALVRLGVRSAKHYQVRESLQEVDSILRRDLRPDFLGQSMGFYRYRFDGYGENSRGRLWPLLTGERIHYELQWLKENMEPNLAEALETRLLGFESFANAQNIFAEQVWDEGNEMGKQTGSAAPLSWSHAEYIQLLRSLYDKEISDEFPTVRQRYGQQ